MRKLFLSVALLAATGVSAQGNLAGGYTDPLEYNKNLSGCNYASYFTVYNFLTAEGLTKQTPAPDGYEAFYITSYHRHGSRWLGSTKQYQEPIDVLKKGESKRFLTPTGNTLIGELQQLLAISTKENLGQLTRIGAAQHRDIARRMCANFPEVFDENGHYYAQSSTVKRCVLSMNNECAIIDSVTHLHATQVNGLPGMQDRLASVYKTPEMDSVAKKGWTQYANDKIRLTPYKRIVSQFFTNTSWLTAKEQKVFVQQLFDLAQNMRSHDLDFDLNKYFTAGEIDSLWTIENREWYYTTGPSPITKGMMPLRAKRQLVDILEGCDSIAYRKDWHGINLRFGHDTFLAPLACLMELGTCGTPVAQADIDKLGNTWRIQEISPMGGNIQVVFYRPKNGEGDVLVKAMLNEREVTLPGTPVTGPYYRWSEICEHWKKRIK